MQVENDYDKEVYNGDLGVVSRLDMEEGELAIDFGSKALPLNPEALCGSGANWVGGPRWSSGCRRQTNRP